MAGNAEETTKETTYWWPCPQDLVLSASRQSVTNEHRRAPVV
jgi:hypothetical protein